MGDLRPGGDSRFGEDLARATAENKKSEGLNNLGEAITLEAKYQMILEAFDTENFQTVDSFHLDSLCTKFDTDMLAGGFQKGSNRYGYESWTSLSEEIGVMNSKEKFLKIMKGMDDIKEQISEQDNLDDEGKSRMIKYIDNFIKFVMDRMVDKIETTEVEK